MSVVQALRSYSPVLLNLQAGDVLVIHAALIHRGIFTDSAQPSRVVLQIFDCCDNETQAGIMHVPGRYHQYGVFVLQLAKIAPVIWLMSYISYLNAATGYRSSRRFVGIDVNGYSSEGLAQRAVVTHGVRQPTNVYILANQYARTLDLALLDEWTWQMYTRNYINILSIILFVLAGIVYICSVVAKGL
jgi:hypothetical protein